jgi:hypothetical protein
MCKFSFEADTASGTHHERLGVQFCSIARICNMCDDGGAGALSTRQTDSGILDPI